MCEGFVGSDCCEWILHWGEGHIGPDLIVGGVRECGQEYHLPCSELGVEAFEQLCLVGYTGSGGFVAEEQEDGVSA